MEIILKIAALGLVGLIWGIVLYQLYINYISFKRLKKSINNLDYIDRYKDLTKSQLVPLLALADETIDDILIPKVSYTKTKLKSMNSIYTALLEKEMYEEAKLMHMLISFELDNLNNYVKVCERLNITQKHLEIKKEVELLLKEYSYFNVNINNFSNEI